MAIIHGAAGEWARVQGVVWGLWPFFLGVFFAGASMVVLCECPWLGMAVLVAVLAYCSWSLRRGMRQAERFFKGARGEERVSEILRQLPDCYHVFNDFVAVGAHIDHVVVGPAGVFAVETKFWRGKVTIDDGHILLDGRLPDRSPLAQVLKEAKAVKTRLTKLGWTGPVTPLLAFASDTFEAKIAELQGAVVMNSNHLMTSFSTDRVVLPKAELERLINLMENNG